MSRIFNTFARALIVQLRRVLQRHVLRVEENGRETAIQAVGRHVVAATLEFMIKMLCSFPVLHPQVIEQMTSDLNEVVQSLWRPAPWRTA